MLYLNHSLINRELIMEMKEYKVVVKNNEEAEEVRNLFELLGYKKESFHFNCYYPRSVVTQYRYEWLSTGHACDCENGEELTLPQLRDLVAQSKSKVREYLDPNDNYKLCLIKPSDAAHWMIEVPEGATLLTKDVGGYLTFWNGDLSMNIGESGWNSPEEDSGVLSFDEYKDYGYKTLWSREPIQEQGLISGADALRALADGKEVQQFIEDGWVSIRRDISWRSILGENYKFRLKPRTITLSLEIPATFEPKVGEKAYRLAPIIPCGYTEFYFDEDENEHQFGAWDSEEKIKQVVAAFRGALKNG